MKRPRLRMCSITITSVPNCPITFLRPMGAHLRGRAPIGYSAAAIGALLTFCIARGASSKSQMTSWVDDLRACFCNAQSRADLLARPNDSLASRLANHKTYVLAQTRIASRDGVIMSVKNVAIPSPKTTAVANCFHHYAVGLSTV